MIPGLGTKLNLAGAVAGEAYSLAGLTASGNTKHHTNGNGGIFFSANGLNLYLVVTGSRRIYRYSMSTAWNLSTLTYVNYIYTSSSSNYISDIHFKPDGSRIMTLHYGTYQRVNYLNITSWALSGRPNTGGFNIGFNAGAFTFNAAGTKCLITDYNAKLIKEYSLSAWNNWLSYVDSYDFSGEINTLYIRGICASADGTHIYLTETNQKLVLHYTMSTAFDLTTISYVESKDISSLVNSETPYGIFINADGTKLYVNTTSETIHELNFV